MWRTSPSPTRPRRRVGEGSSRGHDPGRRLTFNGLAPDGSPYHPPLSLADLIEQIRGDVSDPLEVARLASWNRRRGRHLGPKEGVDPRSLAEAGWGVVFPAGGSPLLRRALAPLLAHRRAQATAIRPHRYRELSGDAGYRPGESKLRFLARHGSGPGPVDPDRVPYYLLLVGGPEEIPFSFQYQLDVQHAVGRIAFDSPEEYASYAESLVRSEERSAGESRVAFFAAHRDGDLVGERLDNWLAGPLARDLARDLTATGAATPRARVWSVRGRKATPGRLGALLGGGESPDLLFTATHGLGCRLGDDRQAELQGALVCADGAPGADAGGPSPPLPLFTAADVAADAHLGGLLLFAFACYSAGTPRHDGFAHRREGRPSVLADRPFVARLPQRLLGHPRGGAGAVVGHVDRAWTYSFGWPGAGRQVEVFASTLRRLLAGHPVGSAMEFFNQRYAELECDLAEAQQAMKLGEEPDLVDLTGLWTARNDARSFVVLGDPAVRLPASSHGG